MSLLNGDSLELLPTLPDASVDMILTDLPYGTTRNAWDSIIPLEPLWKEFRRVTKPNAAIVMTAAQPFTTTLIASNMRDFRYDLVWEKSVPTGFLNANRMPLRAHESVLVFYRALPTYNPQMTAGKPYRKQRVPSDNYGAYACTAHVNEGTRHPRSVLKFSVERGLHPTQKPVSLMRYLIETYTHPGETVLDVTMGSGTTGVAAKETGRAFIGMEMSEEYFKTACVRIENTPCPS